MLTRSFAARLLCLALAGFVSAAEPINISGVYPHLTMRNNEGECGTGAVVPWAGSLWAITYAPHKPGGSSDKLYQVTPDLTQKIFPGSVGGTPANRMIHRESNQLFIGPYVIGADKAIRVISPKQMFGRHTGNARHLTAPAEKIYYATMEEGLYEVDVRSLEVTCLIRDGNGGAPKTGLVTKLPGYHGKGLYSSQGRLVYANNGERDGRVKTDPTIPSGALAQWFGKGDWQMVRRAQFTEVTGPGGLTGNPNPDADPVWAMGWDARSLILALLEDGNWYYYRLPKGSHSYDGSHGWNTEWPRIRDIGEPQWLATMHGTFWKFPPTFSRQNSAGIAPRSNYLKVIGDFCRWQDRIVLGCDDSAKSEFINTRPFKAKHGSPLQSNSNLWFVEPERLDDLGPVIGRGSVWLRDDVKANSPSDPYLFAGYDYRQLHLAHHNDATVKFRLEVDRTGNNTWEPLTELSVPAGGAVSHQFPATQSGAWVRLVSEQAATGVTASFQYRNRDPRTAANDTRFAGIAGSKKPAASFGLMRSLSYEKLGLVASSKPDGSDAEYYELNQQMELVPVANPGAARKLVNDVQQPKNAITVDNASVLVIEDGRRYRLPKSPDVRTKDKPTEPVQGDSLRDLIGANLAIGAEVSVSSTHDDYRAEHAVDGKLNDDSRWIGSNTGPTWIAFDLGAPKKFRSVWVVSGWEGRTSHVIKNFDLQVRRNGIWETLPDGKVRGNEVIEREIVLGAPTTAQHLRLLSTDDGYVRLYELALFDRKLDIQTQNFVAFGEPRVCREVATERDLLNVHGTFYELPARNAQGLAKIRPVATHNLAIHDFCSHNGLLLFTGIDANTKSDRIFRSADGKAAVWAGVVDELWKLGKPRGIGGPWFNSAVHANTPSDPYLMTAYDRKQLRLYATTATAITAEIDVDGTGLWMPWKTWKLAANGIVQETFPEGFSAYWIRFTSNKSATVTAQLTYE